MLWKRASTIIILTTIFLLLPDSSAESLKKPLSTTEKIEKLRMGKESFESVRDLHYMWYVHSIKALLMQVGKQLLPKLSEEAERDFLLCLRRVPSKTDLTRASECLVRARQSLFDVPTLPPVLPPIEERVRSSFIQEEIPKPETITTTSTIITPAVRTMTTKTQSSHIVKKKWKKLTNKYKWISKTSPRFSVPWLNQEKRIKWQTWAEEHKERRTTSKDDRKNMLSHHIQFWKGQEKEGDTRKRVKRSEHRLVDREGKRMKNNAHIRKMSSMPALLSPLQSPIQQISKTILNIVKGDDADKNTPKWLDTYKNILKIKKSLDDQSKGPGSLVYDLPMEDLVLGRNKSTTPKTFSMGRSIKMPPIVEQAFNLADSVRAHTSQTKEDANFKALSPRFAPLLPDKYDTRGVLSPSILSFYKDDAEDQIAPIPTLLEATGMNRKDRESMLEMIMEVSGARETVQEAFDTLKKLNIFGMEGELFEVTKRIQGVFQDLEKGFTRRQRVQMKKRKFAFLDKNQLANVYDKTGIKKEHHEELNLAEYGTLSHKQREESLWKRIELIAANGTDVSAEHHSRNKRQIVWLSVLKPTVLAPYMFTPIFGLTVLGPVVLSPSLFSPLILNPAMLSPYVLSPAVGMPFILSPYFLSPYVLSPLVMAPFILNPYVLSPNVINPYVLSPLILSPIVLGPDVVSPMVLGGAILSPSVASPAILSKSVLMASVLSPSFLS